MEVDEKELQSCYDHLVEEDQLKIESDVSFSSTFEIANLNEMPQEKIKEIENEMSSLGFNVSEIQRLQNYIKTNEDFLMLAHNLRMKGGAKYPQMDPTEFKRVFKKASLPKPTDFKSKHLITRKRR